MFGTDLAALAKTLADLLAIQRDIARALVAISERLDSIEDAIRRSR